MYSNYTFYFISSLQAKLFLTASLQFPNSVKATDQLTPEDGVNVLMILLVLKDEA